MPLVARTTSANEGRGAGVDDGGGVGMALGTSLVPVRLKSASKPFVGQKTLPGPSNTCSTGPCSSFSSFPDAPDAMHAEEAGSDALGSG